jgi:hypothetical protein
MNESDCSEALVMPSSSGSAVGGRFFAFSIARCASRKRNLSTSTQAGTRLSPGSSTCTLRIICDDDDLDVLVVDRHALRPVDVLDLAQQVVLDVVLAVDAQDVVRDERTFDEGLARAHAVARCTRRCLPCGTRCSRSTPPSPLTRIVRLPRFFFADLDHAVDLGHDRRVLRPSRLEQLGHARQTTGDVLVPPDFARRLGEQRAGADLLRRSRPRCTPSPGSGRG